MIDIIYISLHFHCPLFFTDFKINLNFLDRFSKKSSNIKFHANPSIGNRAVPRGVIDGRTDMRNLIVTFRRFTKTLNNGNCKKINTFSDVPLMSPPPQNFMILLPIIENQIKAETFINL